MNYHFFDYKHDIVGFTSDLFSVNHIVFIVLAYILTFLLSYLFRRADHKQISLGLRILSVAAVLMEATKIGWESYHDIATGRGFNSFGILPLYTCSLFIYTLLCAAWGRGKVREYSLSFLCTVSLLYGAIGVIYCNGLNWYPFWTFGAFYSMFFHTAMFAVGVFLLMTGYVKLNWADCMKAFVPILLLSLVAIPVNYLLHSDYMLIYSGGGVPLYEDLAAALAEKGMRWVYTVIMMVTHIPLACLVIGLCKLIRAACKHDEPSPAIHVSEKIV